MGSKTKIAYKGGYRHFKASWRIWLYTNLLNRVSSSWYIFILEAYLWKHVKDLFLKYETIGLKLIMWIVNSLNKVYIIWSRDNYLKIIATQYDPKGRFIIFIISKPEWNLHREALFSIYMSLYTSEIFLNFGQDIIVFLIVGIEEKFEKALHHNIVICYANTFDEFYIIKDSINTLYLKEQ